MPWTDTYSFGGDFLDLRQLRDRARVFEAELARELSPGHLLYGRTWSVAAQALPQDEVVVYSGEQVALVHLTRSGKAERLPWPEAVLLGSAAEFESVVRDRY
jgi:hypothetical protein